MTSNTFLTPHQVSRALGVSESSLKRWCDKGIVETVRTAGGHRRVPYEAVVRFLRESGHEVVRPDVLGLPAAVGQGSTVLDRAVEQLHAALVAGDEAVIRRILLDLYLARHPLWQIGDEVLAPALHAVGSSWQCGEIDVYQERRGCEIVQRALFELVARIPSPEGAAPKAIGGTLAGDAYRIAGLLCEAALRESGWNAESLGSSLPAESIEQAVDDLRPRLLWLSVSHADDPDETLHRINRLTKRVRKCGTTVAIGGRLVDDDFAARLRGCVCCRSLKDLIEVAERAAAADRPS